MNSKKLEQVGIALSFACAIHCLLMPILILVLSAQAEMVLFHPIVEWIILPIALSIGVFTLKRDFSHHGQILPIIGFAFGCVLVLGAFVSHLHPLLGAGMAITAMFQVYNWFLHRKHCSAH